MKKGKILFIDTAHPVLQEMLELDGFICDNFTGSDMSELIGLIDIYNGLIIRSKFKIDPALIGHANQLRFIGRVGAGMENIDVKYAEMKVFRQLVQMQNVILSQQIAGWTHESAYKMAVILFDKIRALYNDNG